MIDMIFGIFILYSNPEIPERSCFNDSHSLDGKELFKRLCFSQEIKTYGSKSTTNKKTFDQCTLEAENEGGKYHLIITHKKE